MPHIESFLVPQQKKMRYLLLALCLATAQAFDDGIFGKLSETTDTDELIIDNLEDETDMAAEEAPMEDPAPNEEIRRQIVRPPRPILLSIAVPPNQSGLTFKTCYCYRRMCYGGCEFVLRLLFY